MTVRSEERQIQRLSNNYVKFVRLGQSLVATAGAGLLGYITDSGYLTGILFRDMRGAILDAFTSVRVLDLHGVAMRGALARGLDENVFDITQGVSIALLSSPPSSNEACVEASAEFAEVQGDRQQKYAYLSSTSVATTGWVRLSPTPPKCLSPRCPWTLPIRHGRSLRTPSAPAAPVSTAMCATARESRPGTTSSSSAGMRMTPCGA